MTAAGVAPGIEVQRCENASSSKTLDSRAAFSRHHEQKDATTRHNRVQGCNDTTRQGARMQRHDTTRYKDATTRHDRQGSLHAWDVTIWRGPNHPAIRGWADCSADTTQCRMSTTRCELESSEAARHDEARKWAKERCDMQVGCLARQHYTKKKVICVVESSYHALRQPVNCQSRSCIMQTCHMSTWIRAITHARTHTRTHACTHAHTHTHMHGG